ncbi:MAG: hypothetical protein MUF31_13020, partial [Akkermansiaceae bacterium]|nr:hypothetical protein [Akkermansiaceae bacterium]
MPTTADHVMVDLTPGAMTVDTADFGYYVGARVEALLFWDANQNGIRDDGEVLLSGVTVTLSGTDGNGAPVSVTGDTTSTGFIPFLVPAGNYSIQYDTAELSSLYPALGIPTTVTRFDFEAVAGEDGLRRFEFGVDNTGSIGDTVFADIDGTAGSGVGPGAGDAGLAGVTVNLYLDQNGDGVIDYNAGDELISTTLTDSQGQYLFSGLPDTAGGQEYVVEVLASTLPGAYQSTAGSYPVGADPVDSTFSTTLINGQSILTADFGYPLVPDVYHTVSGTIHNDNGVSGGSASDGIQNGGEPGIANVAVTIAIDADANGSEDQTYVVLTDATGFYSFNAIPDGASVRITVDEGSLPSAAFVQTGDPDGAPLDPVWTIPTMQVSATDIDFGYVEELGSITGTVVI